MVGAWTTTGRLRRTRDPQRLTPRRASGGRSTLGCCSRSSRPLLFVFVVVVLVVGAARSWIESRGSVRHNMKELRPSATNVRILFIFDPERQAVLLVAGDKAGNWSGWYDENIPIADDRYDRWLAGGYDNEEA